MFSNIKLFAVVIVNENNINLCIENIYKYISSSKKSNLRLLSIVDWNQGAIYFYFFPLLPSENHTRFKMGKGILIIFLFHTFHYIISIEYKNECLYISFVLTHDTKMIIIFKMIGIGKWGAESLNTMLSLPLVIVKLKKIRKEKLLTENANIPLSLLFPDC